MKLKSLPNFPKMKELPYTWMTINAFPFNQRQEEQQKFMETTEYNKILSEVGELECPSVPSVDEMSIVTSEFIDENFPKGEYKERGQALVLHAQMLIAIYKLITKRSN